MIIVTVNIDLYRYEIQALVKAFYPEEEVKVLPENEYPEAPFLAVQYENDAVTAIVLPGTEQQFLRKADGTGKNPLTEKSKESKDVLKHLI